MLQVVDYVVPTTAVMLWSYFFLLMTAFACIVSRLLWRHVYQHPTITPDADQTVALQTLAVLRDIAESAHCAAQRQRTWGHYPDVLAEKAAAAAGGGGGQNLAGQPPAQPIRRAEVSNEEKKEGCFAALSTCCACFLVTPLVWLGRICLWAVQAPLYTLEWFVDRNHKWRVIAVDRALLLLLLVGYTFSILLTLKGCEAAVSAPGYLRDPLAPNGY